MSKQIRIEFERDFSEEKISFILKCVASVVAPVDPTWQPEIKTGTSADRSYQIDRNNDWWLHFDGCVAIVHSRHGSDELMDAIGVVLMYRLPLIWRKKLLKD